MPPPPTRWPAPALIAETLPISGVIVFTGLIDGAARGARAAGRADAGADPVAQDGEAAGVAVGCYAVHTKDIGSFEEMIAKGKRMALRHGFGQAGSRLIALAGVPFGTPGRPTCSTW